MTAKEIQKRNVKANQLKVMQSEEGQFFVESSKGKILYNVAMDGNDKSCTCGDYARNAKKDPAFVCKHILAVENSVPENEIESAKFLDKNTPKLKDGFLKNIKGKDFVLYAGVLDLATQKGLLKLEVELLQFPTKENGNEAICRAIAEGKNGETFSDIGDANPNNCAEMISKHLIRLSSTRAKGRALRDMCNIGIACLEELESMDDVIGSGPAKKITRKPTTPKAKSKPATKKETVAKKSETKPEKASKPAKTSKKVNPKKKETKDTKPKQNVPSFSEAQKRAIYNLSRRRGISVEDLDSLVMEDYGTTLDELSSADASDLIRSLQQAA
ncbi:MAG: SWIM zinc finger family protein [Desulfobacula sp.]|nr:SWIM zinc finger family protein [Desulfobacula sp.]